MELLILGAIGAIGAALITKATAPVLKPVPVKKKQN